MSKPRIWKMHSVSIALPNYVTKTLVLIPMSK